MVRLLIKSLSCDTNLSPVTRNNKHSLTEEISKLQELGFWLMT